MKRVFIVEDDENIRMLLEVALRGYGYEALSFETAEELFQAVETEWPRLVLMDRMLPGMNGVEAIRRLRSMPRGGNLPILMLTARDSELDKVVGLDAGADDYMTKPFGTMELGARIRSLLRRGEAEDESVLEHGKGLITMNQKTREVRADGETPLLTFKEYELLRMLLLHKDRVLRREEIFEEVWGSSYEGESRTLDMHIRSLRQKLGERAGRCIVTHRGVGYRMEEEVANTGGSDK